MPNVSEIKSTRKKRLCVHCNQPKMDTDFYPNADWKDQLNKDCWCKQCLVACKTKKEAKTYFWENNRVWNEKMWSLCTQRAQRSAATNDVFNKSSTERRAAIIEKLACQQIPHYMNLDAYYKFRDNTFGGKAATYEDAVKNGFVEDEDSKEEVEVAKYSRKFNGKFTQTELEYLEDYYTQLEATHDLDNVNRRDYAKKICIMSLISNKALDDFRAGKIDFSIVKDATAQFDVLAKSAEFAECRKKDLGDGTGNSYSELTYTLETTGHCCQMPIHFEEDDVDLMLKELEHIVVAIGLE